MKTEKDIEALVGWALCDEMPKLFTSSAEGIWDRMEAFGALGADIRVGGSGAQRYSSIGLPDPDAERISREIAALPDVEIDWDDSASELMGEMAGLLEGRVLMVGSVRTAALVTMHGKMGTRPNWREEQPLPEPILGVRGRPSVVGECLGKARYTTGSHCPMKWFPSPVSIVQSRGDYAGWYAGLCLLAERLRGTLAHWEPTGPAAPISPWRDKGEEARHRTWRIGADRKLSVLPLKQPRPHAGPTMATRPGSPASAVRIIAA